MTKGYFLCGLLLSDLHQHTAMRNVLLPLLSIKMERNRAQHRSSLLWSKCTLRMLCLYIKVLRAPGLFLSSSRRLPAFPATNPHEHCPCQPQSPQEWPGGHKSIHDFWASLTYICSDSFLSKLFYFLTQESLCLFTDTKILFENPQSQGRSLTLSGFFIWPWVTLSLTCHSQYLSLL